MTIDHAIFLLGVVGLIGLRKKFALTPGLLMYLIFLAVFVAWVLLPPSINQLAFETKVALGISIVSVAVIWTGVLIEHVQARRARKELHARIAAELRRCCQTTITLN